MLLTFCMRSDTEGAQEIGCGAPMPQFLAVNNLIERKSAHGIAEAQVDLLGVRHARHRLLSEELSNPDYLSPAIDLAKRSQKYQ